MKISQDAKEKTKIKILRCAVDLIIKKGFKDTSMREIAQNANVSNPTIYNYFATKEQILYSYIEYIHSLSVESLKTIPDFETYTLREQLQSFMEIQLQFYLEDREFIEQIYDMAFESSSVRLDNLYDTNRIFIQTVQEILDIAIEAGEINKPPFLEYVPLLFWDYFVIVVAYWIKDDSKEFENTTQFIDYSMSLIESTLHSNIMQHASNLALFFLKTHFKNSLENLITKKMKFGKKSFRKRQLGDIIHG